MSPESGGARRCLRRRRLLHCGEMGFVFLVLGFFFFENSRRSDMSPGVDVMPLYVPKERAGGGEPQQIW